MVPYSHGHVPGRSGLHESSPERVGPRRRGLARDPFLARVAVMLGGEALAPVRTRLTRPGDVLAEPGRTLPAVYGILSDEGKSLFVADGVNEQDSYWEMDNKTGHSAYSSGRAQEKGQKLIREGITRINELYKFRPGAP